MAGESEAAKRDEVLKRMLGMAPKPHDRLDAGGQSTPPKPPAASGRKKDDKGTDDEKP
jgi:hypothetical protein